MSDNKRLAFETLLEANDYVGKLINFLDDIIENFLAGREDLALKDFANLIDGFQWIISVIDVTKPITEELGLHFSPHHEFNNKMNEMVEAFENRDYVLVGDLLNYEIKPLVEQWQEVFEAIAIRINENHASN